MQRSQLADMAYFVFLLFGLLLAVLIITVRGPTVEERELLDYCFPPDAE